MEEACCKNGSHVGGKVLGWRCLAKLEARQIIHPAHFLGRCQAESSLDHLKAWVRIGRSGRLGEKVCVLKQDLASILSV